MRFKSPSKNGFQIFAVTGVNTVSFAVTATAAARKGLLGFAVERLDPKTGKRFYMQGFKVFPSLIPNPNKDTRVSTEDHPVQSLVWDDFTAAPERKYRYFFHPMRGKPGELKPGPAVEIAIETEPLFSKLEHDVFFNRGVASSQAYADKFDNKRPDDPTLSPQKQAEAREWLSRKLDDALLQFIKQAAPGDGLLGCFYEFRYLPVAEALRAAIDRGVDVQLILDAKVNETTDEDGTFHESFPREDNLRMLDRDTVKIPTGRVVLREAKPNDIQHNKFMVLLRGAARTPTEVWTGSTNLSDGGIHGQTNVGHWVRNAEVARQFQQYWTVLGGDPGGKAGDDAATTRAKNAVFKKQVEAIRDVPTEIDDIPAGVTPVFSPRSGKAVLDLYVKMVDSAAVSAAITLAFGINKGFKAALKDNTGDNHIIFMLLEKKDAPTAKNRDTFVAINAKNNVYKAWGSFIKDPLYQWTKETNAKKLGLNQHVSYVHSKFLLMDPLGADPIVVTGSANFSDASTNSNDENMLIVRGDRRVADIYFTEFNRLFNHYYFRSVVEETTEHNPQQAQDSLFLKEKAEEWLVKYKPGGLRQKRVDLYAKMAGFA